MSNVIKELNNLKNTGIVVICDSKKEAKELFALSFPYGIRDLTEEELWEGEYCKQGFKFSDAPYNSYCSEKFFVQNKYETIKFKDFMKKIRGITFTPKKRLVKTKRIDLDKGSRLVTVVVLSDESGKLYGGFSILNPEDKNISGLSEKIAIGRATNPRTNVLDMELGKGMNKTYIFHAVADSILFQISKGAIKVKGIN